MRYIDTSGIVVPANWHALAVQQHINPAWSFFKQEFEKIVGKKCWYSESDNSGSKNTIDHFRPKAANVRRLTSRNADLESSIWLTMDINARVGYSFLEFEFNNYRYSCDFSNSLNKGLSGKAKGKSNFFPLQAGSPYATDILTLANEVISLLDPCQIGDASLLFFSKTGQVEAHLSVLKGTWNYSKVMTSIELYHLHYYRWIEKRQELWNSCKTQIELVDLVYGKPNNTLAENQFIANAIKFLLDSIDPKKEFSATAIDCVRFLKKKGGYNWLENHFPDAILIK